MLLVCLCGVVKGSAHAADCPYPEYGTADGLIDAWEDQHAAGIRAAVNGPALRVARPVLGASCGDCGCRFFMCNEGCGRLICGCYHSCGRAS